MAFNKEQFQSANFMERTEKVPVPELKDFFDEGNPEWEVRGLTGPELAKVNDASKQNKAMAELIEGFASENYIEKVEAIKESLGLTGSVPDEIARGIALIKIGSIEPVCSQEMAVRLANVQPVPFYRLWRKIMELSGLGQSLGESSASTITTE